MLHNALTSACSPAGASPQPSEIESAGSRYDNLLDELCFVIDELTKKTEPYRAQIPPNPTESCPPTAFASPFGQFLDNRNDALAERIERIRVINHQLC